jgi:hypothetical protein
METFKIVIDFVKEDKKWKCFYKPSMIGWDQMVCMSF